VDNLWKICVLHAGHKFTTSYQHQKKQKQRKKPGRRVANNRVSPRPLNCPEKPFYLNPLAGSGGWWHIQHQTPQSRTGERNKAKATAAFPAKRAGVPAFGGISYRRFSREASARVAFGQRDLDPKGAGGWPWAFSSYGFYVEMVPKKRGGFLESIDI